MDRQELAEQIYKASYLVGTFKLRSGQASNEYFDKYQFESQPKLLRKIARAMAKLLPQGTEVLAGLEMGGIPLATALSLETEIPTNFVRKKAKKYGTCLSAEGADIKGKQVCIIEDVVTTGGQILLSTKDLRSAGAKIDHVLCAIYRGQSKPTSLIEAGLNLKALFTMEELKKAKTNRHPD